MRTVGLSLAAVLVLNVATSQGVEPVLNGLTVAPAELQLRSARARQQILVTGTYSAPDSREQSDLTRVATYESLVPSVALVTPKGIVVPNGFGDAEIVVRHANFEARVKVHVSGLADADPIDFETDVIAALSRAGCNAGACHGSPKGKNGFRLSLRGFEPHVDFMTLGREALGRRTNVLRPDESLVLKKPLGQIPHQGGVRFRRSDPAYQILRTWIQQGRQASSTKRKLEKLEVLPAQRRLASHDPRQQLVARAHFDDGTVRDVTNLAVFTSNKPNSAKVSPSGFVEFEGTAETTILVRYLDKISAAQLAFVERDADFVFSSPPAVNAIDTHVFAKHKDLQLLPAKLASDAVFLRRVYLDAIGTLPTTDEARRFLDSTDARKRSKLINSLLDRDEFAFFWALKWADVMRGSDVTISKRGVHRFHRYLVQSFRQDKPFNQFARETLTSLGNTLYSPAANFHRIARTPGEAAEATAQLFLGVRIQCAKCHNHPFEAISQDDYYGLAAYFARVKFKGKQFGLDDEIVYLARSGEVRHPTRNHNVAPNAFGQPAGELTPDTDRRQVLVDWLTQPDNPYFARATVNRVWYHLFSQGIVEPVDDFRATNPPSNAELLDSLAADFAKHGYRIKPIVRAILNSNTYQLSSKPAEPQSVHAAEARRYFTHAAVRMLSAEQVLDAVTSATGLPVKFPGYPKGTRAIELAEGTIDHPFLNAFSKPVRDVICECAREDEPSLNQVIHLINNPEIIGNIHSKNSRVNQWIAAKKPVVEIVELMYLTTLSRRPTAAEYKLVADYLSKSADRAEGFQDLQHALLNSNEFLLRH